MDLADGKLAYQQTKPFITTRGVKPLTPKGGFSCFCQPILKPHSIHLEPFKPFKHLEPHIKPLQTLLKPILNLSNILQVLSSLFYPK